MSANNALILHGRVSSDLVVKGVDKKAYMFFNVAVGRFYGGKEETDFLFCKAFGTTAEFIAKWFKKGSVIALEAEIRTSKGPDDKYPSMYVHVNGANFPVQNKTDGAKTSNTKSAGQSNTPEAEPSSAFPEQEEDSAPNLEIPSEDLPF